ncbi:MAG TPA: hypothetical protein VJ733_03920, partial [Candidatus Binatia bacterium]|nr:hypothetical protein [Candidatus Binatia bacterium]
SIVRTRGSTIVVMVLSGLSVGGTRCVRHCMSCSNEIEMIATGAKVHKQALGLQHFVPIKLSPTDVEPTR